MKNKKYRKRRQESIPVYNRTNGNLELKKEKLKAKVRVYIEIQFRNKEETTF